MGYANKVRALSIALLGLLIIGAGLASDANAGSCSAEAKLSAEGSYQGCVVKMGNREFTVDASQSSAEGCSAVCGIMAEVGGAKRGGRTADASRTIRQ